MAPKRISIKGAPRQEESTAAGTITPGHLIMLDSANKVVVHATEGGFAEKAFAKEDALQGKVIADDYSSGDLVTYDLCKSGDEEYVWLKAGESVVPGDKLISAGDGTLIQDSSATSAGVIKQIIAVSRETLDLSASGAVDGRIVVRVM